MVSAISALAGRQSGWRPNHRVHEDAGSQCPRPGEAWRAPWNGDSLTAMEAQPAPSKQAAKQAFERHDYRTALDLFEKLAQQNPHFADVRHYAGLCESFLGNPEAALEQFDYAIAANPAYVEAHINRALTLNELGRFEEARDAFDQAGHFE